MAVVRSMEFEPERRKKLSVEGRAKLRHWLGREYLGPDYSPVKDSLEQRLGIED